MSNNDWQKSSRNNEPYRRGQGGGSQYGQYQNSPAGLPAGYLADLKSGYFSPGEDGQKRAMRKEFIIDYPRAIADALNNTPREQDNRTQLRKYFDYCVRIRTMLGTGRSFQELKPEFARLVPFANYAKTRGVVSQIFVDFIEENVNAVHDGEDFSAFLKHFEAIVAFIKKV